MYNCECIYILKWKKWNLTEGERIRLIKFGNRPCLPSPFLLTHLIHKLHLFFLFILLLLFWYFMWNTIIPNLEMPRNVNNWPKTCAPGIHIVTRKNPPVLRVDIGPLRGWVAHFPNPPRSSNENYFTPRSTSRTGKGDPDE